MRQYRTEFIASCQRSSVVDTDKIFYCDDGLKAKLNEIFCVMKVCTRLLFKNTDCKRTLFQIITSIKDTCNRSTFVRSNSKLHLIVFCLNIYNMITILTWPCKHSFKLGKASIFSCSLTKKSDSEQTLHTMGP